MVIEWWLVLPLLFGSFFLLLMIGMPVAFAFMLVNIVGVYFFWGGAIGLNQLIFSIDSSISTFTLLPAPMFILMGSVMFRSGVGFLMMDALDKWIGRIPGRLSLLAVGGGTLFSTLSGTAMGSVAMLGSVLVPEMEKRGYKKPMSLGPILGSGGLAIMVPPTFLGIILASLAEISIGRLLIAIIIPGLMMALLYATYIIMRCKLQPSLAPIYESMPMPLLGKIVALIRYVLPIGFIVFLVLGLIFLGIASPTEAAALGALGCYILAAAYRRFSWQLVKKSVTEALSITVMIFMILTGSVAFSQILAYTGVTAGIVEFAVTLPVAPIVLLMLMQVVLLISGMFIEQVSIMMVTIPIFMPIVWAMGWNPVWFGAIFLLNMEIAATSPPFGVVLFVMKGVAPADTTMGDIYRAAIPFILLDIIVIVIMMIFPEVALWLPSQMFIAK